MKEIIASLIGLVLLIGFSIADENLFLNENIDTESPNLNSQLASLKKLKTTKNLNVVKINAKALDEDLLQINLPNKNILKLKKTESQKIVKLHTPKSKKNWIGNSINGDNAQVIFSINTADNKVNGTIRYGLGQDYQVFLLMPLDDQGNHVLIEQDWRNFGVD